ncbi:putative uncharacterized protein ydbH [Photobacterium aphoticum]|uniref:Uncharacterized protein n=1 Tax=Photobacterium aphoticum TaxID=754436 RepID=A0A090QIR8_9GAMM|nr:putative uncharacterized protein ydbH [Photobacterium aphoticum]
MTVDTLDDADTAPSSQSAVSDSQPEQTIHPQIFNDFTLVLTTEPHTTLTGSVGNGQFTVFFPQDSQQHQYPIDFESGQFSVSWENHQTPLAIHLAHITPRWASVTPNFQQSGHDLTLRMNIDQPLATMKVTSKSLALDQPVDLPTFVEKPDEASEGIHLGQTIAHLAQLPLRKLKVERFTYRNLLVNSKVVIETPHFRMNKPDRKARLHIKGQALAPNPYDINVLVKHRDTQLAHVKGSATGPKGNTVTCEGDVQFDSPLPKQLVCKGDIKQTRDITDKFDLTGVPNLRLNAPITFTAKQTQVRYKEPVTAADPRTHKNANKDTNKRTNKDADKGRHKVTSKDAETGNKDPLHALESAKYQLSLSLPKEMMLALPAKKTKQPDIMIHTDTQLTLTAHYQQGSLSLVLDNVPEPVKLSEVRLSEKRNTGKAKKAGPVVGSVTQTGSRTGNALTVHISQLRCTLPIIRASSAIKSPDCRIHADVQGYMKALEPHPESRLTNLSLQSKVNARWTANTLTTVWQNTRLHIDAIALQPKDSRCRCHRE